MKARKKGEPPPQKKKVKRESGEKVALSTPLWPVDNINRARPVGGWGGGGPWVLFTEAGVATPTQKAPECAGIFVSDHGRLFVSFLLLFCFFFLRVRSRGEGSLLRRTSRTTHWDNLFKSKLVSFFEAIWRFRFRLRFILKETKIELWPQGLVLH